MLREIKKEIEKKVKLLGSNFNPLYIWEKEMILIEETKWEYFPEFRCVYYADNQVDGTMEFNIRFANENQYLNYIDLDAEIQVIL